ncbi:MAG TPA: LuxR C-terminal-related transcriptional regulator [Ktedonobacterales bacterium]
MLWSGRDYARASDYYRLAHERAQASGDASAVARSLNSLGNWLLNVDRPAEALRYHREALAAFEALGDQHGIAETLDFLGITSYLSGDLFQGTRYYERGVALLRELNERKLLASALAPMPLRGMTWQTDCLVPAAENLPAATAQAEESLAVAREIGWSAGEAFARLMLGCSLSAQGDYGTALDHVRAGKALAAEIEHQQWLAGLGCIHGSILLDIFALDDARATLAEALAIGRAIGSAHWVGLISSPLARCLAQQGAHDGANAVLDATFPPGAPATTLGQFLVACARIEVALARGEPERALMLADAFAATTPNAVSADDIPRVAWLRGRALAALGRHGEAERSLLAAERHAHQHGARPLLWRVQADLCALALARGGERDTGRETSIQQTLAALAQNIPDPAMRAAFQAAASAHMPLLLRSALAAVPAATPRRSTAGAPGGLTAREREVAVLVAEGLANRAIAGRLVVGERTVETHVTNILGKLGFTNRAQIAAWAVAHQLAALDTDGAR